MLELTREEKIKLLEKLSPRLQELMTSEDTGANLLYLGKKYHLSDHQVRLLSKILGDVILGIIPATNSSSEISAKVAIDIQTANSLVQDLNDLILSPKPAPVQVTAPVAPVAPAPKLQAPTTDQYREPINGVPEIIDLRKTPVAPAPTPPMPKPTPPLTFTKPIERPLIEADPHKIMPPAVSKTEPLVVSRVEPSPQYIIRPPGLPPTDFPRDVLDLRKDKGEF